MYSNLHVAHLNLAREFRGGERQTMALIEALAGQIRQTAVVRRGSPLAERLENLDVRISAASGSTLNALKATHGFDLLHVHEGRSPQVAALRNILSRTPFIVTRRVPQKPSVGALWCYRRAQRVVAVSDAVAGILEACDNRLPLTTIRDCVSRLTADSAAASRLRHDGTLVIGQVGELDDSHKGQRLTIDAAGRLAKSHPHVRFWLIGQGKDEQSLRDQAAGLTNVHFIGWTERIADYYAAMDILVYPSNYEGLGSAMLEAMQFAVPVVAACVGGIPEIVKNESNGLLFSPGDLDEFVLQLTRLLDDAELRKNLADEAKICAGQYSDHAMAQQYLALYQDIVTVQS